MRKTKRFRDPAEFRAGSYARMQAVAEADTTPWNPPGGYPLDGTIIEVEGRGLMRFTRYRELYQPDFVDVWTIAGGSSGPVIWSLDVPPPTGRWRVTPPATERAMSEADKRALVVIRAHVTSLGRAIVGNLDVLAAELRLMTWDISWPDPQKRAAIAASITIKVEA